MEYSELRPSILYYSHFYYPEVGAGSIRAQYFVKVLKEAGYSVKVITPIPNYSLGKEYDGFGLFYKNDKKNNITYLPIYISKKYSFLLRGVSYISFALTSFFYLFFKKNDFDIVITSTPPIFTALSAAILARVKKKKFILDVRDIWPDIGIELKILKNNNLIKYLFQVEKFIYHSADYILVTAGGDKKNIAAKNIAESKIELVYNGADIEIFKPLNKVEINDTRVHYHLPQNKLLLIYFGSFNYGMNDIELMAECLAGLSDLKEKFHIVFVGNGDNRKKLEHEIDSKISFTFIDSLNPTELAKLIAASDVSLIPRKRILHDTGGNIPVKCFESWASGIPIVLSAASESEASKLFNECQAGFLVEPGDINQFREVLIHIISDQKCLSGMGLKGREFVEKNFDRSKQAGKLLDIISNLTNK